MITRLTSSEQLAQLPKHGVEAQKIRALLYSYGTDHSFCRFFRQGSNTFLAALDGTFVIQEGAGVRYAEIAEFLAMNGFSEIFCSRNAARGLSRYMDFQLSEINLMRFCGNAVKCDVEREPKLDEVFAVLEPAFGIEYEPWYLDMSHRVRHRVSQCRMLEKSSVAVIQHDINGEALLSQVATLPSRRGEGLASKLIGAVCAELLPSDVYVLCEDSLIPFYRKCGFEILGKKCQLYSDDI